MPYIRHLYYEEAGAGRPVILIHCPAVSHLLWRPLMARLRTICRCIAIDVRGHGKSGLGDCPWSLPDAAADLAMLVHRLDLKPAPILVGYSAGGLIALQAALDNPDLYAGFALIGGFSEVSTFFLKNKVRLGLVAVQLGLSAGVARNVVSTNHLSPEHARCMLPEAESVRPRALGTFYRETLRTSFTARLGEIRQPVLLIYGEGDRAMLPYYEKLMAGLPHGRAAFIPQCDHRVPTRHPAACADLLAEFVAQLEPPESDPLLLPSFRHPGVDLHAWDGSPPGQSW